MTNEKMIDCSSKRSFISDVNGEALFADGFDDAIIGVAQQFNIMSVAYNRDKCIEILMKDMDQLEAIEYFEFNVIGAYVGEQTPTFIL